MRRTEPLSGMSRCCPNARTRALWRPAAVGGEKGWRQVVGALPTGSAGRVLTHCALVLWHRWLAGRGKSWPTVAPARMPHYAIARDVTDRDHALRATWDCACGGRALRPTIPLGVYQWREEIDSRTRVRQET